MKGYPEGKVEKADFGNYSLNTRTSTETSLQAAALMPLQEMKKTAFYSSKHLRIDSALPAIFAI